MMWCCSVFMVFEYCEHDMGRLLDSMARPFSEAEIKCLMRQVKLGRPKRCLVVAVVVVVMGGGGVM